MIQCNQQVCIPKILHFIWIGKEFPVWGNNAIQNFQNANPTFKIQIWHYSSLSEQDSFLKTCLPIFFDALEQVLIHPQQKDPDQKSADINTQRMLQLCYYQLKFILGKNENMHLRDTLHSIHRSFSISDMHPKLYSAIGDCLKFLILQRIGGIYLDLDTFPILPFDNELLCNSFSCYKDVYFLGTPPHDMFWYTKTSRLSRNLEVKSLNPYQRTCKELNKLFWQGVLQYNSKLIRQYAALLPNKQYIYHFAARSWCKREKK